MSIDQNRLRVALLADDFNPDWPSLPIVGFKYAIALAEHADVTVYTHVRNRPNLDKAGTLGFQIAYLDNEYIASPVHKFASWLRGGNELGWTIQIASSYLPYVEFERLALREIKNSGSRFDIVHRITPMSPTLPSYASGRTEAPFVIGPLNGNLKWPREFYSEQQRERETLSRIKAVYKFLPFWRSTFKNASAVLAAFPHTISSLPNVNPAKVFDVPEIGYDPDIFYARPRCRGPCLTFLYAGRLVPYKLSEVAVLAFAAQPELRHHRLRIVGSGPEQQRLEELIREHGLENCIEFVGRLSQGQVADEMRNADVFFFPSIRELGAGAVIEALACGLPCLVADYGAPGALVNEDRGLKVRLADRATMVLDFADAAVKIVSDRVALDQMSEQAAEYAEHTFTWKNKAAATIAIYEWALGKRVAKPEFVY